MPRESKFQSDLIKELKRTYPGCIILKNDCNYIQGIPDLTIFYKDHWACLEVKASEESDHRPNQDYYVNKMNNMSFARFIYPENKEMVMNELRETFGT